MPLGLHLPDLLMILAIALLVFGPKKLPEMGASIGKSITAFKKGMRELEKNVQDETKDKDVQEQLEQRKSELETLEHEIVQKKAAASSYEAAQVVHADPSTASSKLG